MSPGVVGCRYRQICWVLQSVQCPRSAQFRNLCRHFAGAILGTLTSIASSYFPRTTGTRRSSSSKTATGSSRRPASRRSPPRTTVSKAKRTSGGIRDSSSTVASNTAKTEVMAHGAVVKIKARAHLRVDRTAQSCPTRRPPTATWPLTGFEAPKRGSGQSPQPWQTIVQRRSPPRSAAQPPTSR